MELIAKLDITITNLLNSLIPHTSFFDTVFKFLSLQGATIIIWIVILAILILFEEKRDKKFIFYFFVSIALSYFLAEFLKNLTFRIRPEVTYSSLAGVCPTTFAFPSGHAAVAFAASTILGVFDRKRLVLYILLAVLISLSRIYLQCHYLLDVLGGALVGIGVSLLVLTVFKTKRR